MELLEVPTLTGGQVKLREEVNRLEALKRENNYLRLNQDPSPYQEASEFTERYQALIEETRAKANAFKEVLEGWAFLEEIYGGVEGLRLALVDLATAESGRIIALARNRELREARENPERAVLGYAKDLVMNAHKAKSVRRCGQGYLDRRAEEVAYALDITTEEATARAWQLAKDTNLTYNAKTETFRQTLSI